MKAKTYSALQKTYDQSHLTCSTAEYYESQGNEAEALRCWRECLAQLQGHNAGGYRPRTETERSLLQSLRAMQDQCQDKVGLLQAILLSRLESENCGQGSSDGQVIAGSPTPAPAPADAAAPYPTLSFTPYTVAPNQPPAYGGSSVGASTRLSASGPLHNFQPTRTPPLAILSKLSRTPSPEKRPFLSTLRPARRQRDSGSYLKADGAAAATAATLAWSSISRAEGATLARTLTAPPVVPFSTAPSLSTPASSSDPPSRQRSFSASNNAQAGPPQTFRAPNALSHTKPRPHSFIIPPRKPPDSPSSEPPAVPVHRYGVGPSYMTSSPSPDTFRTPRNETTCPYPGLDSTPPTPPPKNLPAPSPIPPVSSHSNFRVHRKPTAGVVLAGSYDTDDPRRPLARNDRRQSIDQGEDHRQAQGPQQDEVHPAHGNGEAISSDEIQLEGKERVTKALESISKSVDMQAALQVANEIVVQGDEVHWDDVAGLDAAKLALKEAVVYPFLRPDLFSGLREPARGMLLFGPPGTGKTMLARAVATESKSTFFSISASSLTSKYLGESEKLVRALFALAKALAPSIIFVDEIDSLLSSRGGNGEHEATGRIKTEFLIQWSDLARAAAGRETGTGDASRVLVLAATNLPWAIDDAARRRFVRRQYIPLPEGPTREKQLLRLLSHQKHQLGPEEMEYLIELTDGFSGSDITALAKDAAMGPLRSLGEALLQMKKDDIRPITFADFQASLSSIRPSVSKEGLQAFENWAQQYGERV